jgi:glyoxylase-like metal-dependent hydrolase (beta-lactamase superfamily II)
MARHYSIEQVSDPAWAAIAVPDTGSVGNAGFVASAAGTIVFDTSLTPQAARELRAAAEQVAPIVGVVDSHWHGDHVRGNVVFRDVPIVATRRTAELMKEAWPNVEAMKQEDRTPHLEAGGTPAEVARTIDEVELVLPTETFDERLELGGGVLETLGGGHTESDAFLTVGDVLFAGDLVVVRSHPWLGHGTRSAGSRSSTRSRRARLALSCPATVPSAASMTFARCDATSRRSSRTRSGRLRRAGTSPTATDGTSSSW